MKLEKYIKVFDYLRKPINTMDRQNLNKIYPYYGAQGIVDYIDNYIFDGDFILLAEDGNNLSTLNENIATWATGKFWVNNHAHVIQTNEFMDQRYLYYWLNFTNLSGYITGSAQPKLNKENVLSIEINPPAIDHQQHIVNTIGSVDDLIENYQSQIYNICALLECALDVYKNKCFISEYNPIIIKSGIIKFDKEKTYLDTSCIEGINNISSGELITVEKRPSRANMQPKSNSVWFAKMKDSNKIIVITEYDDDLLNNHILSTGFLGIKSSDSLPLSLLTAIIISSDFKIQRDLNSIGTTMAGVNNETFLKIQVPQLDKKEVIVFDKKYHSLVIQLSYLRRKINFLKKAKEKLLKKYF